MTCKYGVIGVWVNESRTWGGPDSPKRIVTRSAGAGGVAVVDNLRTDAGILIGCGTAVVEGIGQETDTLKG